ncbi:MAG: DUF2322 family protein [Formosimonas sp.]|jgi:hypothetical protein
MLFKTSTVFKENLEQFPSVDSIAKIEFYQDGKLQGSVENADGQKGSLALYYYLFKSMGILDISAARRGLELYAEHTADARAIPGKHPNIDRLILIEAINKPMEMKVSYNEGGAPVSGWNDEDEDDKQ